MYEFHSENEIPIKPKKIIKWKARLVLLLMLSFFVFFISMISAPNNFPTGQVITVENGSSLKRIATDFQTIGLVKSSGLFKTFLITFSSDKSIQSGDYLFDKPLNAWSLAERFSLGQFGVEKIKVTLPEGLTNAQMAEVFSQKLPNFNKEEFLYLTKDLEGYLFPDTYSFFPSVKTNEIVKTLRDNFNKKLQKI